MASELFLDREPFSPALSQFPQCHPIVPYLQSSPEGTIENTLETLRSESEKDPERTRQLAAIRFYLHYVIWQCEVSWNKYAGGVTNYVTLLDQLRRSRRSEDTVCLVTFNYDRMIESALRSLDITIETIPDYIAHDAFKLFKLHGSVDWAREVDTPIADITNQDSWDVGRELIRRAGEIEITNRFCIVQGHPIGKSNDMVLFPALAIPVETKNSYECPDEHLKCLQEHLPRITQIIMVGWRGTEQHFLASLKDLLPEEVPVCVVAGKREGAEEVIGRLQGAGIRIAGRAFDGGFTDFIEAREAEEFLRKN